MLSEEATHTISLVLTRPEWELNKRRSRRSNQLLHHGGSTIRIKTEVRQHHFIFNERVNQSTLIHHYGRAY